MTEDMKQTVTRSAGPVRDTVAEAIRFKKIQQRFPKQFEHVFPDKLAPRTVIIIPSLTMDMEILSKISVGSLSPINSVASHILPQRYVNKQ